MGLDQFSNIQHYIKEYNPFLPTFLRTYQCTYRKATLQKWSICLYMCTGGCLCACGRRISRISVSSFSRLVHGMRIDTLTLFNKSSYVDVVLLIFYCFHLIVGTYYQYLLRGALRYYNIIRTQLYIIL